MLEVVDGLESVRQRVVQRLLFIFREWFYNESLGTQYTPDVLGHDYDSDLARQELTRQILTVEDVTGVRGLSVTLAGPSRVLTYMAVVESIYGETEVTVEPLLGAP